MNFLKLLDTLIDTLKGIADIENERQRSSDIDCKTMALYGEAKETMKRAIRIINDLDNTGMETLDLFLPKLRMYLLGALPSIELKNDERSDCTTITTTTRVTTTATSPTTEAAMLLSRMSTTSDKNASFYVPF